VPADEVQEDLGHQHAREEGSLTMALSEKQLGGLMQKVLSAAKKVEPKAEVLVSGRSSRFAHIRFARNTVTTSGELDEAHVDVTIKLGQRVASASSNQTDDGAIAALVERTSRAARLAPEDPEEMPVLGPQLAKRNDQVFDPTVDAMDAKGRARLVKAALEPGKARRLAVAGFFAQNSGVWGKATSAGLLHVHPATGLELTVTARTPSGTGSGRGNFHGRRLAGLNAEEIATRACEIATRSENPRKLEPGRYTVVLEPLATATLCETLLSAMDQRSADEGRSFFAGKKPGDAIASPLITLRSDPRSPRTPMLPFDDEGRVLEAQPWITGGTLEALGTSRFWAAKTRRKPIGAIRASSCLGARRLAPRSSKGSSAAC
jgi:predicted Zn-dependent protease